MEYTEKDLKKKLKTELVEIAKAMPGFKAKTHNKKEILIAFILRKEVADIPKTKKELLLEKASKYVDFKKTVHGTSVAKLEAFLKSKEDSNSGSGVVEKEKQKVDVVATTSTTTEPDLTKLTVNELRKIAKKYGWTKRTGKKPELIEFIKTAKRAGNVPQGRLVEAEVVVAPPPVMDVRDEDIEEWPISADILAKHAKTVDDLKKLLNAKGIAIGLPRTKKELLELFQKSRCSFKDFTCSKDEFCDLRNNLCRELNILRNKDKEIKKLAKGLVYIDEEKGRFYGTPDAIAKVRQALLHPVATQQAPAPAIAATPAIAVQEETKQEVIVPPSPQQQEQEEGISPININRLLDKPNENEIRRAILHCLGLYHDTDPNDEIIPLTA